MSESSSDPEVTLERKTPSRSRPTRDADIELSERLPRSIHMERISICKQVSFAPALISRGRWKDFRTHNPGDCANSEITFAANAVTHAGQTRSRAADQLQMTNKEGHTPKNT